MRILLACLLACGLSGCIADWNTDGVIAVVCLGDSNTDEQRLPAYPPTWCSMVGQQRPSWAMFNYALSGSHAITADYGYFSAHAQLQQIIGLVGTGALPLPDGVVFAFGTNDFYSGGAAPEMIVAALQAVDTQAALVGVGSRYIRLIPPFNPNSPRASTVNPLISITNALLRTAFPQRTIDCATGFDRAEYYIDDVHWNRDGQAACAAVVLQVV